MLRWAWSCEIVKSSMDISLHFGMRVAFSKSLVDMLWIVVVSVVG